MNKRDDCKERLQISYMKKPIEQKSITVNSGQWHGGTFGDNHCEDFNFYESTRQKAGKKVGAFGGEGYFEARADRES